MTLEDRIAQFLRESCPDPEKDCIADEDACFQQHPVHAASTFNGVIGSAYIDIEGTAKLLAELFCEILAEAIEAARDQDLLQSAELQESLEQMRRGEGRVIRSEDLK